MLSTKEGALAAKVKARQVTEEQKWSLLSTNVALDAKQHGFFQTGEEDFSKKGSLIVMGSGIKSVGHFTAEALSHIKAADKVLYNVGDPATEVYIQDLRPDAQDLNVFHADDKNEYDTSIQMSEVCLFYARRGLHVVCIFYGHPGVLEIPSHRAIQIARKQGIKANMLPAVSAEDCLFADLGIDPLHPGVQMLEATDMLLRQRTLLTDFHVIITCVGGIVFRGCDYLIHNFHVMIKHLQEVYGSDYIITHYVGAQYPMCGPLIERISLSEFLEEDTVKKITKISTIYIPPKEARKIDTKMALDLGLIKNVKEAAGFPTEIVHSIADYSQQEIKAIQDLEQWTVPKTYVHTPQGRAAHYVAALATDIRRLKMHMTEPERLMEEFGLSEQEVAALQSNHPGRIHTAMKQDTEDSGS